MTDFFRATARVVLLDDEGRTLLFLTKWPSAVDLPPRWITPGGGVDSGESVADAARRELFEETGLEVADLGEPFHVDEFRVPRTDGHTDVGHATYFVHRAATFEVSSANWTAEEHDDVLDHRWWTVAELEATRDPLQPTELADVVRTAIEVLTSRGDIG